jgi:AcrR family transcriptional regulator
MAPEPGLRERKKQQTREAIAAAAFDLFAERGFDAVAVSEVARRAGVSEATVFNYFRTKEDLVYSRLEDFEAAMLRAVRERGPGQSVLAAFRAFLLTPGGLLAAADPEAGRRLATITRIITGSRALRSRERQIQDGYTDALARHIAAETSAGPDDIRPWVVANALTGVHRAILDQVRARVLAGDGGPRLARRVGAQAERAFDLLASGLADYPPRPAAARGRLPGVTGGG